MTTAALDSRLHVAIILSSPAEIGGGHSYETLILKSVMPVLSRKFRITVFHRGKAHSSIYKYSLSRFQEILQSVRDNYLAFRLLNLFGLGESSLERKLSRLGVDVAYFASPNSLARGFNRIPIVTTVWDLAHRSHLEFPEVTTNRRFEYRDLNFAMASKKSICILVESETTKKRLKQYYGIDDFRVLVVPFPKILPLMTLGHRNQGDYVIYAAQMWPHKNHQILLRALALLKSEGESFPQIIFCGSDKGNRDYLIQLSSELGVEKYVDFRGFVSDQLLMELIGSSVGLVNPSYFGPTNIPPIEGLRLGVPVAVGLDDEISEFADGKVIYACDPDDVWGWAQILKSMLIAKGRSIQIDPPWLQPDPANAMSGLIQMLEKYAMLRNCWNRNP